MINFYNDPDEIVDEGWIGQQEVDMLPMNYYQDAVEKLILTYGEERLFENTLGLVGEAGEFAEKIKKYVRDGTFNKDDLVKELGDVLFYTAALSTYLGVDLSLVAETNLAKLQDREIRGVLRGSGDSR